MQNRPQQSEIDTALMTFKTTLDGITTEAKEAAATGMMGETSVKEGYDARAKTKK
jgi:hypothetical protein